ncbi:MAG: hypothetical protein LBV16_07100 [Elusimicrobiota bacterium]|jgi:hypothetical protein|nr:hypothetical protein [Elusimicrobiota bacterium]
MEKDELIKSLSKGEDGKNQFKLGINNPDSLAEGMVDSLTVEDAKYGSTVIRNNQIADFSANVLPYSGLGSGLKRAFKEQPNIELINDISGEQFIVQIPRPNTDEK